MEVRQAPVSLLFKTKPRLASKYRSFYSMMQSDGNSFGRDVVSESFNKTMRDEENILDQIYKSQYVRINIMMILILYNIIRKFLLTLQ